MQDKMSGAPEDVGEIAFWVDLNTNMATGPTHEYFDNPGSFKTTEAAISFSQTTPAVVINYEIDRMTGALSAAYYQKGVWFGTIKGHCEKSESLDAKF